MKMKRLFCLALALAGFGASSDLVTRKIAAMRKRLFSEMQATLDAELDGLTASLQAEQEGHRRLQDADGDDGALSQCLVTNVVDNSEGINALQSSWETECPATCNSKIDELTTKLDNMATDFNEFKADVTRLSFDIAADAWCQSKGLWTRNQRAVKIEHSETKAGGHEGQSCSDLCAGHFPDHEEKNWSESNTWQCVAGGVRIAPDYAQDYEHINQSYGGSNNGHWASHYWRFGCDAAIPSTNGHTYCCCSEGNGEDHGRDLIAEVLGVIGSDMAQSGKVDAIKSDITRLSVDIAADSWCQSKGLWMRNSHAIYIKTEDTTNGEHEGQTCNDLCAARFPEHEGKNWDESHTWACVAGYTRIAPDYGQDYEHVGQAYGGPNNGHWASHYWTHGCDATIASNNGATYCCCADKDEADDHMKKVYDMMKAVPANTNVFDELKQDVSQMSNDIAADTWCQSKGLWTRNQHAIYIFHQDTVNGGHEGQNCNDLCAARFPDHEGKNWDESHRWTCTGGYVRIAPDYGQDYTHVSQAYDGPNNGHWASHYWGGGCDSTINSTNGSTYCCCVQKSNSADLLGDLRNTVSENKAFVASQTG